MNRITLPRRLDVLLPLAAAALTLPLWPAAPTAAAAEGPTAVARCGTPAGSLFQRAGPGKPWQTLKPKDDISGGQLLVGLPGAALDSRNGAVRLTLLSDLARQ